MLNKVFYPRKSSPWHKNLRDWVSKFLLPNNPDTRGLSAFEDQQAKSMNQARLENLENLGLPLNGKRVLDVGCGVGHLAAFFTARQCQVVCIDARKENLDALKNHYPSLEVHCLNIETDAINHLGDFDIVFCYGLLYHLENIAIALRKMAAACKSWLLLETMVTDHAAPLTMVVDESLSSNQALHGIGHRPTPSYVTFVLNRLGFGHIYTPLTRPTHPDFQFSWKNNLENKRNGHDLRCIFLASRERLSNDKLVLLTQSQ